MGMWSIISYDPFKIYIINASVFCGSAQVSLAPSNNHNLLMMQNPTISKHCCLQRVGSLVLQSANYALISRCIFPLVNWNWVSIDIPIVEAQKAIKKSNRHKREHQSIDLSEEEREMQRHSIFGKKFRKFAEIGRLSKLLW